MLPSPDENLGEGEVEVLVTGFGPYDTRIVNPSWEVVRALPAAIEPALPGGPRVVLRTYPSAIKISYDHVRYLVPVLYQKMYPRVRFFVHVGVHSGIQRCRVERRARKGPYQRCDVDGKNLVGNEDGDGAWEEAPNEIESSVDVEGMVRKLLGEGSCDIEGSDDAGLFLCEFIYYNSLLEERKLRELGKNIMGVFLHIPLGLTLENLQLERDTLMRVIQEMVGQSGL